MTAVSILAYDGDPLISVGVKTVVAVAEAAVEV